MQRKIRVQNPKALKRRKTDSAAGVAAATSVPRDAERRFEKRIDVFSDLEHTTKRTSVVPVQNLPEGCPKRWSGLVGNKFNMQQLRKHAKSIANTAILIHGPSGVGKTSACRLAFQKIAWVHDLRTIGSPLIPRLKRLCESKRHYPQEVVLLDPMEEVTAIGGAQDTKKICDIVARAIERKSGLGFVLVANNIYTRAMYPLRCNAKVSFINLRFYPLQKNDVKTLLLYLGMSSSKIKEGVRVAGGDGRKATQFAKGGSSHADRALNKFETCSAAVKGDKNTARNTDSARAFLNFWEANMPLLSLGSDRDATATPSGIHNYALLTECASFADITSKRMYSDMYAFEATLACAKSLRLHHIPMGKGIRPISEFEIAKNRTQILQKSKMMGIRPQDLHEHVRTLQKGLRCETDRNLVLSKMKQIDRMHKQWNVSAEIGQLSLETQFLKKQSALLKK